MSCQAIHFCLIETGMLVALIEVNRFMSPLTEIEKRSLFSVAGNKECYEGSEVAGNQKIKRRIPKCTTREK